MICPAVGFTSVGLPEAGNLWVSGLILLVDRIRAVRLGSTGLKVSRLCLGVMTYGDSAWRPWLLSEYAGRPFIKRALEHGINFFDTPDMYSLGKSEEVLGRALKDFASREKVVIATKADKFVAGAIIVRLRGETPIHQR